MQKITCTVQETAKILRQHGFPCCATNLSKQIAEGIYPFGRVIREGPSGRKTIQIFRRDLMDWISHMSEVS